MQRRLAFLLLFLPVFSLAQENLTGNVTISKPKIWRFDRVAATLDGMLRDIDAVQLSSMTALNPNEQNGAAVDLIQTYLSVKAKFDQGVALDNSIKTQQLSLNRESQSTRLAQWNDQKNAIATKRASIRKQMLDTMAARDALDPKEPASADQKTAYTTKLTELTAELDQVDKLDTGLGAAPTLDASGTTNVTVPGLTDSALKDTIFASKGATDALTAGLAKPSTLPATKQLDNFITLLHERVSRQLSVFFDDASRDNRDLYMVQFDIGVRPPDNCRGFFHHCTDQILKVQFAPGGDVLAYDLYPGMSSYNMAQYWGKSTRTGITGAAQFLFGFGITAEYQRQHDQATSAMTQSVYLAGFGAGTNRFGWYLGPGPQEQQLAPGIRTVYAILSLSRDRANKEEQVMWNATYQWQQRNGAPLPVKAIPFGVANTTPPSDNGSAKLRRVSYKTQYLSSLRKSDPIPAEGADKRFRDRPAGNLDFNFVQLDFDAPVDSNLIVTVNGTVLKRVRDFRAMATRPTSSGAVLTGQTFGILESDDANTEGWFAVSPRSIVLKLSRKLVGTDTFPQIRVLEPGSAARELTRMISEIKVPASAPTADYGVQIDDHHFLPGPPAPAAGFGNFSVRTAPSILVPLFSDVWERPLLATRVGNRLHLRLVAVAPPQPSDVGSVPLDDSARVLALRSQDAYLRALECHMADDLVCVLQPNEYEADILVEEAGRSGKMGIFGRAVPIEMPKAEIAFDIQWKVRQKRLATGTPVGMIATITGDALRDSIGNTVPCSGARNSLVVNYPAPVTASVTCDPATLRTLVTLNVPFAGLFPLYNTELTLSDTGGGRNPIVVAHLPSPAADLLPHNLEVREKDGSVMLSGPLLGAVELRVGGCTTPALPRRDPKTHKDVEPPFRIDTANDFAVLTHVESLTPGLYPITFSVDGHCYPTTDKNGEAITLNVPKAAPESAATPAKAATKKPGQKTVAAKTEPAAAAEPDKPKTESLIVPGGKVTLFSFQKIMPENLEKANKPQ